MTIIDQSYDLYKVLGDNIEVDDNAVVEDGDEGAWVQARIYVPHDGKPDATMRLLLATPAMLAACKDVVASWESGDLAAAVRCCASIVEEVEA